MFAICDWYTKKQGLEFFSSKSLGAWLPFKLMENFRNLAPNDLRRVYSVYALLPLGTCLASWYSNCYKEPQNKHSTESSLKQEQFVKLHQGSDDE